MKIIIRKGTGKDIVNSAKLVSKTFAKFNSKEGTPEGVKWYIDFYNPKKNLERINKQYQESKIFFVATINNQIVGVIRGTESRVKKLFVNGKYHNKGIATKLMNKFETEAKKFGTKEIKIRASLYAVGFYKKMGYKKTTGIRKMRKNLIVQPMIKKLK